MNRDVTIYALRDPLKPCRVQYVGCTVVPLPTRLRGHLLEAGRFRGISRRLAWVWSLMEKGRHPIIEALDTASEADRDLVERQWIEWARFFNPDLLNR